MKSFIACFIGVLMCLLNGADSWGQYTQLGYRWRNDDGSEATATWKTTSNNTPITLSGNFLDSNIRLRIIFASDMKKDSIRPCLYYSDNYGVSWKQVGSSNASFNFGTSNFYIDNNATLQRISNDRNQTYVRGLCKQSCSKTTSSNSMFHLNANEITEIEFSFRPTTLIKSNTEYWFRTDYEEVYNPATVAKLNTNCLAKPPAVSSPISICVGDSITLSAKDYYPGVIEWFHSPSGGQKFNTGKYYTTPILFEDTRYYVSVRDPNEPDCISSRVEILVNVHQYPEVDLGKDTLVCGNTKLILADKKNDALSYLWDNGSTAKERTINLPGRYYVKAMGKGFCYTYDTIHVNYISNPQVKLINDTIICIGDTILVDAYHPAWTYLWDDKSTLSDRKIYSAGKYYLEIKDTNGCKGADTFKVNINYYPIGEINAVYKEDGVYEFSITNGQFIKKAFWDPGDGSPLIERLRFNHHYKKNGIYTVTLSLEGSCDSSVVTHRTVDVWNAEAPAAIKDFLNNSKFKIFPQPIRHYFKVNTTETYNAVELWDVVGRKVAGWLQQDEYTLPSSMAKGIYRIRILNSDYQAVYSTQVLID